MALPLSGPISLSEIQSEFSGIRPISINQYYRGGTYVNQYSEAPNVPTSGTIKFSDFYGASHYVPISRTVTLSDGQRFTVPTTIRPATLTVTLIGGSGGNGGNDVSPGYPGYPGHVVTGTISVQIGDIILASVGGAGVGGGTGGGAPGGTGGYGGVLGYSGGTGGYSGPAGWSGSGAGGGGATAVQLNGTLVAVAGGGGGGGGGGWHSNGRPQQSGSTGVITGGHGTNKDGHDGNDGGGGGGGGGGDFGGIGGSTVGGDEGAYSGADGQNLIPAGGSASTTYSAPTVTIQGIW